LLLDTVKEKGGKPDRNHTPFSMVLRNPYNLKSENSQDYARKPQRQAVETRPNRLTKFLFSSLSRQSIRKLRFYLDFIVCSVNDCESVKSIGVEVAVEQPVELACDPTL
jgi:hypothetical protein